ncbi:unnamed protein product [Moneuplotes crassus]|uniref:PH domain-containing protein n=1 Tax=Euplotes crassus TaxID=5936 RepID=A0AAD1UAM0_EUPCR|nr:unnamed protein product [Moneuplotes crassus]
MLKRYDKCMGPFRDLRVIMFLITQSIGSILQQQVFQLIFCCINGTLETLTNKILSRLKKFDNDLTTSKENHKRKREVSLKKLLRSAKRRGNSAVSLSARLSNWPQQSQNQPQMNSNYSYKPVMSSSRSQRMKVLGDKSENSSSTPSTNPKRKSYNYKPRKINQIYENPLNSKVLLDMIEKKRRGENLNSRPDFGPSAGSFSPSESALCSRASVKYDYKEDPQIIANNPFNQCWSKNQREKILIEGKVYKYNMGEKNPFMDRWLQITQKGFLRVYKNHLQSLSNPKEYLLEVPLEKIEEVKKIHFTDDHLSDSHYGNIPKYCFMFLYTEQAIQEIIEKSEQKLREECVQNKENNCHFQRVSTHKSLKKLPTNKKAKKPLKIKTKEESGFFKCKIKAENEIILAAGNMAHTPKFDEEISRLHNPDYIPDMKKCSKLAVEDNWIKKQKEKIINEKRLLFAVEESDSRRDWIETCSNLLESQRKFM